MNIVLRELWTVPRFLAWEDGQEGKHEFDGTRIIEMTGGSRAHQRIVANLLRLLEDSLDPVRFDVVQEMRVNASGTIRYPDISVVTAPITEDTKTLHDAVVLFEVLSEDTAEIELGPKLAEYARLQSIRRYVTIDQRQMGVTSRERTQSGWTPTEVTSGSLELPELGTSLPLPAIYRRVRV
ncbi:MAG TPA: Uma2 family endonuclease [Acetobacteraceae bacterium]|jgi:Uma2 family endonuclease|nr:Uma2 family endonuclease [Acetobacteraceae bacterium]